MPRVNNFPALVRSATEIAPNDYKSLFLIVIQKHLGMALLLPLPRVLLGPISVQNRSLGVLVTTKSEFRRYPRLACPKGRILAWQTAHKKRVSAVDNAGLGGLYILTPEPPAPGTFIQLLLDVPAGEVRATAVVQRSEPNEGMGVKFVAMEQEDRVRFSRWLKRLSSS